MNKKTTKKPLASKSSVATKGRPVSKSKLAGAKRTRKTAVAAKKTTQRKGIRHHAKRIYHLTPKFIHGMVAGAFVGVVLVTSLGITGGVFANPQADACINTLKFDDGPGGRIQNNGTHAKAMVKLDAGCGTRKFVMKAYYAPSHTGEPHNQQVHFSETNPEVVVKVADNKHWTSVVTTVPPSGCFYQVDLVDVTHPASDGKGNPIVVAKTGGNHDCTPDTKVHTYACASLGLTPGDNRTAAISNFNVTAVNTTFTGGDINWGDNSPVLTTPTVQGQTHQYAADGNYTVSVVAHFTYVGQFGKTHDVTAPACSARILFSTPPPGTTNIYVCEISTKLIITIDEKLFGTEQYPTDKYTKDLSLCVVTGTPEPPSTLANTGPGAVLIVFGLSLLGGYAFHMRHRHVQRKKTRHHSRHTPHHAK